MLVALSTSDFRTNSNVLRMSGEDYCLDTVKAFKLILEHWSDGFVVSLRVACYGPSPRHSGYGRAGGLRVMLSRA